MVHCRDFEGTNKLRLYDGQGSSEHSVQYQYVRTSSGENAEDLPRAKDLWREK